MFTHMSDQTVNCPQKIGWEVLQYPPHSSNLAPSDYHLSGQLKQHIARHRLKSHFEVMEATWE
jgi:hypothetical protein